MLPLFNFWDQTWFFGNVRYHGTTVHASSHPNDSYMEYMGMFPKIGGKPPKWMVKIRENPIKIDDLGCKTPYFWVDTHI